MNGSSALRGAAAVVGIGTTTFGRLSGYSADDLGAWALREALADAGLTGKDIDGLVVSRVSNYENIASDQAIQPHFVAEFSAQGRMSGPAIAAAAMAIASGSDDFACVTTTCCSMLAACELAAESSGRASGAR